MNYRIFLFATATLLVLGPTMAAQSREQRQMNADIRMLQEQTQRLELMLNTMLSTLGDSVQTVSQKLDTQADINRKATADLKLVVDNVSGDVRVLREKLDETIQRVGRIGGEIDAIQTSIQSLQVAPPPAALGVPGDQAAGGLPVEAGAATAKPVAAPPPGLSPRQVYVAAEGDYLAGRFALAITGFESFLKWFTAHPDAAKAQYYIGESYRQDNKLEEAVAAYDKVMANYPTANVVAEARYKRGDVLQRLGRLDAARGEYETVVKNYPESPFATMSKQRLDGLLKPAR